MNRSLLIMVLLCATVICFANRKIDLNSQARFPKHLIDVFINKDSKELTLVLKENSQNVRLIITDLSGNNIYNNEISVNGISVIPLPVICKGQYTLFIYFEDMELYGLFEI